MFSKKYYICKITYMRKFLVVFCILFYSNCVIGQKTLDVFDIARKGTVEQVKEALKENPNSFNVVNEDGYSPLVLACYKGNNEVAKLLIETGSDINGKSKMGTPLMAAVVNGNLEIVKLLLSKKVDVDFANKNGITALMYAVQFQNSEIIKLLLQNKPDKSIKDNQGKTAFEYAVFSRNEEIINLLK
jgi:ankyrin repeat protein